MLSAEPRDEPLGVIPHDELADEPARLAEILEAVEIETLLLKRAPWCSIRGATAVIGWAIESHQRAELVVAARDGRSRSGGRRK